MALSAARRGRPPWAAAGDNWPAPSRVTWVPQPSPTTMQHSKKKEGSGQYPEPSYNLHRD
jgi:hypothetical protein